MSGELPPFDGPMQMHVASLLSPLRVSSWCQARTSTPLRPVTAVCDALVPSSSAVSFEWTV